MCVHVCLCVCMHTHRRHGSLTSTLIILFRIRDCKNTHTCRCWQWWLHHTTLQSCMIIVSIIGFHKMHVHTISSRHTCIKAWRQHSLWTVLSYTYLGLTSFSSYSQHHFNPVLHALCLLHCECNVRSMVSRLLRTLQLVSAVEVIGSTACRASTVCPLIFVGFIFPDFPYSGVSCL